MALEFSQRIRRIPSYPVAGGYAEQAPMVRLASNESPYPPLPAVADAIERALSTLNRYPDPSNSLLRARLSDRYGVPASRIAIGNGSCDILLAAGEALLEPGAELVYAWPSRSWWRNSGNRVMSTSSPFRITCLHGAVETTSGLIRPFASAAVR